MSEQALHTFSQFIAALEDGELHGDLSDKLVELAGDLQNHAMEHGGSPKGQLKITLDFKFEKGVFEIDAKVDTKLPKSPRLRSILWATAGNHLTPFNPKQLRMFDGPQVVDRDDAVNQ